MEVINNKNLFNQLRGKKYFEDKKIELTFQTKCVTGFRLKHQ